MSRLEKYEPHPAMKLLRRSVRKEWALKLIFAFLFAGIGNWFGWYFFKRGNVLAAFGLASVLLGVWLLWSALRRPSSDSHPLFYLMKKKPEKIVWVYSENIQSMPFGFHLWDTGMMHFKLSDGGEITVSLPAEKLKMVSKFLNRILPHASFGYSEEKRQQFETDPTLLRK